MDQRRQISFIVLSMGFFILWINIAPILFPGWFPKPGPKPAAEQNVAEELPPGEAPAETPATPPAEFAKDQKVLLGEAGYKAGFLVQAQCTSRGGAIEWVQLTDPRYTTLDRKEPLKVVGSEMKAPNIKGLDRIPQTLENSLVQIDAQLSPHGLSLATVDWQVVEPRTDPNSVTFRYPAPDGTLEVLKTYRVLKSEVAQSDVDPTGYFVECDLVIRNLSDSNIETSYTLQGPVGVPLENAANTIVFREVKVGTLSNLSRPERVTAVQMDAATLVKQHDKSRQKDGRKIDSWHEPIRYVGVDNQFFAALLMPKDQATDRDGDGTLDPYFESAQPSLMYKADPPTHSDMTVSMNSRRILIPAGQEARHTFQLFCGPKRSSLLEPLSAGSVLQYGWFSSVSKVMLWILNFFHTTVGLHYALSIMALTVLVRLAMLPITRKQLAQAERMKEIAPKMKEIQEKYKQKPEELGRAMNELYKKHNVHPASGCLPMLIQLPIFIGLYRSLQYAIDLRLAQFLWIDNLAGPDALFQLGFKVPYFEWTEFNLLPILAVVLIVVQQKFMMPPPTTDEQAMQYRIINVMMIVMGVFFYRTQAGLMIYILTTTVWGLAERLVLKRLTPPASAVPAGDATASIATPGTATTGSKQEEASSPSTGPKGWFEKLQDAADQAHKSTNAPSGPRDPSKKKPKRS